MDTIKKSKKKKTSVSTEMTALEYQQWLDRVVHVASHAIRPLKARLDQFRLFLTTLHQTFHYPNRKPSQDESWYMIRSTLVMQGFAQPVFRALDYVTHDPPAEHKEWDDFYTRHSILTRAAHTILSYTPSALDKLLFLPPKTSVAVREVPESYAKLSENKARAMETYEQIMTCFPWKKLLDHQPWYWKRERGFLNCGRVFVDSFMMLCHDDYKKRQKDGPPPAATTEATTPEDDNDRLYTTAPSAQDLENFFAPTKKKSKAKPKPKPKKKKQTPVLPALEKETQSSSNNSHASITTTVVIEPSSRSTIPKPPKKKHMVSDQKKKTVRKEEEEEKPDRAAPKPKKRKATTKEEEAGGSKASKKKKTATKDEEESGSSKASKKKKTTIKEESDAAVSTTSKKKDTTTMKRKKKASSAEDHDTPKKKKRNETETEPKVNPSTETDNDDDNGNDPTDTFVAPNWDTLSYVERVD